MQIVKNTLYFFAIIFFGLEPFLMAQENVLRFIENKNQWENSIQFRLPIPAGFLSFYNDGLQYSFFDAEAVTAQHASGKKMVEGNNLAEENPQNKDFIQAYSFSVKFIDALPTQAQGLGMTPEKRNYFLSEDPTRWASEVSAFQEVRYPNIYEGITLNFFQAKHSLKYEFVVLPQADVSQIRWQYDWVTPVLNEVGELVLKTPLHTLIEKKPYCFQEIEGRRVEVPATFVVQGNVVNFAFPEGYDKNYPLVIDPELVFSTYSGSFADNWGNTATYDDGGNLYLGGTVFGINFPTTLGAFTVSFQGEVDVAIHKYNSEGNALLYATYLGGTGTEVPHSLVVNPQNELIILGTTGSNNFPTTATAFDRTFNNPSSNFPTIAMGGITFEFGSDLFISKLNSTGSALLASTFVGGTNDDGINIATTVTIQNYGDQFRGEVTLDNAGNIYVVSTTNSTNFPVSSGAYKSTLSGFQDVVLMKFPTDLSSQIFSTYFGGNDFDAGYGLRFASNGDIFITGATRSTNLPTNTDALHTTPRGDDDGFIAKFSNTGAFLQATYLGTSSADQTFLIEIDDNNEVYVVGQTLGTYPITQGVYSNANGRQFIHKLDNNLSTTRFSTVFGSGRRSAPDISPTAFLVNSCQNLYVTGWGGVVNDNGFITGGSTNDMPITNDAYKKTTLGNDFYIIILEKDAKSLLYGSFFGSDGTRGDHVDGGTSRFDKKGIIYHAACACSSTGQAGATDFPTTPQAWSRRNNSFNCNMAAFKFDIEVLRPAFEVIDVTTSKPTTQGCFPFTSILDYTGTSASSVEWRVNGQVVGNGDNFQYTFQRAGIYTVEVLATNRAGCVQTGSAQKTFLVLGTSVEAGANAKICKGQTTQLQAVPAGAVRNYRWAPITGLDNPDVANPKASPEVTTEYVVRITDFNGCVSEDKVTVEVLPPIKSDFAVKIGGSCGEPLRLSVVNQSQDATKFVWNMGDGTVLTEIPQGYVYADTGKYVITLTASNEFCDEKISKEVLIEDNQTPLPNVITPNGDGKNDVFILPNRSNYNLSITNRWGVVVYQQDNYQNDWGEQAESGTYYFVATSRYGVECKGWLQVLK